MEKKAEYWLKLTDTLTQLAASLGYTMPEHRMLIYLDKLNLIPGEVLLPILDPDHWMRFPTIHEIKKRCRVLEPMEDQCREIFWHLRDNHTNLRDLDLPKDVLDVVKAMGGRAQREQSFGMWPVSQEHWMEEQFVRRLVRLRKNLGTVQLEDLRVDTP